MNKIAVPGTHEHGFEEQMLIETAVPRGMRDTWRAAGALGLRTYRMGECSILCAREPIGPGGSLLWHLSISAVDRHPSWDEIKTARYRLLPLDRSFGIILPPPEEYVNVPEQDHVFHLHEIVDPRNEESDGS